MIEVIKNEQKNEIKKLEKWTNTTFEKVIFDTKYCDWDVNTSTFNKHIEGYDTNVFIIEDMNDNIFGGFFFNEN